MLDEHGAGFALGAAEYLVKPIGRASSCARCCAGPPSSRAARSLAIDDDPTALDLVDAALEPAGWSVLTATGGAEGVELVRRSRPDIVLLDLLMPGLDGFAVVERLRADPELAEIPIVVMTAKDLSRADRARLRGTVEHLVPKGSLPHAELARLVERTGRRPSNPLQETS